MNMNWKRTLGALLVLALTVGLCACGGKPEPAAPEETGGASASAFSAVTQSVSQAIGQEAPEAEEPQAEHAAQDLYCGPL